MIIEFVVVLVTVLVLVTLVVASIDYITLLSVLFLPKSSMP